MIYYLKNDFRDNVIDGVYSEHHKLLTIVYLSYYNILWTSHIALSSKSHGVYQLVSNKLYIK